MYCTLLYDWCTKACNDPNRRKQISCVIAQVACNVVFMENGSNKLFRIEEPWSTGDEDGEIFPNFELLPCFNIDAQPELVNNNFNDKKESLISRRRNANDNSSNQKKRNLTRVYGFASSRRQGKMTSTDIRSKNNKCSNMNWLPFISPKKADYKRLQDQTQFNWMVHFINKLSERRRSVCMYVRARPKKAGKWGDARAQQLITITTERTGFLAVWK